MTKHYYLVDSENVNDNWLLLLDIVEPDDPLLIFYTNKSPHMSYPNLVKLLGTKHALQFVECVEGANALDFQLVSQLGFYLCQDPDAEYSIMTNDTGFDAVVNYWKKRDYAVNRINVNFCKSVIKRKQLQLSMKQISADIEIPSTKKLIPEAIMKDASESIVDDLSETIMDDISDTILNDVSDEDNIFDGTSENDIDMGSILFDREIASGDILSTKMEDRLDDISGDLSEEDMPEEDLLEEDLLEEDLLIDGKASKKAKSEKAINNTTEGYSFNKDEVDTLLACVSKNDLAKVHNVLTHIYGDAKGKEIYKVVKAKSYTVKSNKWSKEEKVKRYCKIVFANSDLKNGPDVFGTFLLKNKEKCKNLNSIRPAILKEFGETNGMKYYSLFKPHIKTIITL